MKSFKRKYPDLQRRQVEPAEREHLIKQRNLSAMLSPHLLCDLTALRSDEVLDLMAAEYPDVLAVSVLLLLTVNYATCYNSSQEYQKVIAERVKQEMAEKQRQLDMVQFSSQAERGTSPGSDQDGREENGRTQEELHSQRVPVQLRPAVGTQERASVLLGHPNIG